MKILKNTSAALLAATILSTSAIAQENNPGWFVNYSLLKYSGERTYDNGYTSDSGDYDSNGFKLKIGKIDRKNNRISLSYEKLDIDFNEGIGNQTETAIGLDFTRPFNKWKIKTVTPYFNLNADYWVNDGYYTDETMSGFGAGVGIGAIWDVNNYMDVVIGYNYEIIGWSLKDDSDSTLSSINSGFNIGANLKF